MISPEHLRAAGVVAEQIKAALPDTPPYPTTRREYVSRIGAAVSGYLESSGATTSWRNQARKAVVEEFPNAFYAGYIEAGGEETEDEDEKWLTGAINTELANVDALFVALKDLRGTVDPDDEADARAEGYAATLDSVYSEGGLRGAKNVMLTWHLGETEKHCTTCAGLDGKRYSAKKWLRLGYKPREPGSTTLECGGWQCDCYWTTDDGEEFLG